MTVENGEMTVPEDVPEKLMFSAEAPVDLSIDPTCPRAISLAEISLVVRLNVPFTSVYALGSYVSKIPFEFKSENTNAFVI